MDVPVDSVVSLHINNITSDWETYTVSFDAKRAGPMFSVLLRMLILTVMNHFTSRFLYSISRNKINLFMQSKKTNLVQIGMYLNFPPARNYSLILHLEFPQNATL